MAFYNRFCNCRLVELAALTLMTDRVGSPTVSRSWISDTPDEVEHPTVPLGINEMAIPRAALLSLATAALLIGSTVVVGYSVYVFVKENEDAFSVTDRDLLKDDNNRWYWEVDLLFDTCDSRLGDWDWPDVLSEQDDAFLYPGELRCDWEHQGNGDRASVAVYNRGNQTLDIVLEITGGDVVFASEGDTVLTVNGIGVNETAIVEIQLNNAVTEHDIQIQASHLNVREAEVLLDVYIFEGPNPRELHASEEILSKYITRFGMQIQNSFSTKEIYSSLQAMIRTSFKDLDGLQ